MVYVCGMWREGKCITIFPVLTGCCSCSCPILNALHFAHAEAAPRPVPRRRPSIEKKKQMSAAIMGDLQAALKKAPNPAAVAVAGKASKKEDDEGEDEGGEEDKPKPRPRARTDSSGSRPTPQPRAKPRRPEPKDSTA